MDRKQSFIKSILMSICSVAVLYVCALSPFSSVLKNHFGSKNIPSMVICVIFDLILLYMIRNIKITISRRIIFAVFLTAGIFLISSYAMERYVEAGPPNIGVESSLPLAVFIPTVAAICVFAEVISESKIFLTLWLKFTKKFHFDVSELVINIITFFLLSISLYNQYNINFSRGYDHYHLHSYMNSILNIFWNQPFTEVISGIYGHYAYFYYPFLKSAYLLGIHNLIKVYMILNTAQIACILIIWIIILKWNIKNKFVRLLGIFALCYFNASRMTIMYPMIYPHRVLVMSIIMLLISQWYRINQQKRTSLSILGYAICILLIIWSPEFGIFALISWASVYICSALQRKEPKSFLKIIAHFLAIPLTLFCSILVCGLVNTFFGGEMISVSEFFSPFLMQERTELSLSPFPSAWISIMVLLIAFLNFGISDTIFFNKNIRTHDQTAVCFSVAVLGLGSITYAINRPAYDCFFIIMPLAALLISIITDFYWNKKQALFHNIRGLSPIDTCKGLSGLMSYLVLFVIMISTIINIPYKHKKFQFYKNYDEINETAKWVASQKDKEAVAIGAPASSIYAYLGWDPGIYYMDFGNLYTQEKYILDIENKMKRLDKKSAFISDDVYSYIPEEFKSSHKIVSDIHIRDIVMQYWKPIEP